MDVVANSFVSGWYTTLGASLPSILGALLILIVGWIVGRLLGKAVRIVLDKIAEQAIISKTEFAGSVKKSGVTIGYLGDILVRLVVYLIAIIAAVDLLKLEHLSNLMTSIVQYIPHIVAFVAIIVVGFILIDYFIDFLNKFYSTADIEFISPVLVLMRIFLYFVVVILGLSQLMLDLTIIYTFITPVAWGLGIGLGAAIAITFWYGMKDRSVAVVDQVFSMFQKK
ncbi:MAG: hypothetical protein ABFC71_02780 [Methanoregula sp.]|jgi:hypothetical protein